MNVRLCEGWKKPLSDLDASTEHSPEPSKSGWNPGHWASHAQVCPIRPRFLQWRSRGTSLRLRIVPLEKPLSRRVWSATVHGVVESQTRQKQLSTHTSSWAGSLAEVAIMLSMQSTQNRPNNQGPISDSKNTEQ